MVLSRVSYELFAHEADLVVSQIHSDAVQLDRQLRLDLEDGACVYVSWAWGPGGGDYHVAHELSSFCSEPPEVVLDASASPIWSPLINRDIEVAYHRSDKQVLAVRSETAAVYCCSFESGRWGMDSLLVCSTLPD